ncbi:hypothetical protein ACHAXM_004732 [Skeletonema potamos]
MMTCCRLPIRLLLLLAVASLLQSFPSHVAAFSSQQQPLPNNLPNNPDDVIRQAAISITNAYESGVYLQTIRLPLSQAIYGNKEEGFVADRAIGWQGGPMETYRYLSPMVYNLLPRIRTANNTAGLNVKVNEQILLDFDGSSLQTSEHPAGALYDIQALLQPNTDGYYIKTIEAIEDQFCNTNKIDKPNRLFLLVNPAWRDKSSWGIFGAKKAQELILDRYETTYAVDQFIMRGRQISLLKCWSSDWGLYANNDGDGKDKFMPAELIARYATRPEYKDIDAALKGVVKVKE